jgi:hypothetical protein
MGSDIRRYARQTNVRLIAGFIAILFVLGDGLIYLFYGRDSAILGLICLLAGLSPIILIIGILYVMSWFVRRMNER